jgi:hypothetical protein
VLPSRVIRYRRERRLTPDGHEVVAPPPPEAAGHFGPGVVRYILMQHVQGQVTVERLLVQLTSLGIRLAKGQIVALLTARTRTPSTSRRTPSWRPGWRPRAG